MEAEQKVYDLIVEAAGGGEGPTGDEFFGDAGDSRWGDDSGEAHCHSRRSS